MITGKLLHEYYDTLSMHNYDLFSIFKLHHDPSPRQPHRIMIIYDEKI